MEDTKQDQIIEDLCKRYINNPYPAESDEVDSFISQTRQHIQDGMDSLMEEIEQKMNPKTLKMVDSEGNEVVDVSIYTGISGMLVYYQRKIAYYESLQRHDEKEAALKDFNSAFKTQKEVWNLKPKSDFSPIYSFYLGKAGLLTLGYLIKSKYESDKSEANELLSELLDFCDEPINLGEILFGHGALLHCLLLIKKNSKEEIDCLDKRIKQVALDIIKLGLPHDSDNNLEDKLYYETFNKPYIGAAHGTAGILYMLLLALETLDRSQSEDASAIEIPDSYLKFIKTTCEFIVSKQQNDGNFPYTEGAGDSDMVHFCHGAPGVIPFLLQAYKFYNEDRYLDAAKKAGELVFQQGIVKKGNNLCHGIPGNAYCLFQLHSATSDSKWRYYGYCFINATFDEEIQSICDNFMDPGRKVKGVADMPYSLMEGKTGLAVTFFDVLTNEDEVLFPGYDI